MSTANSNAIRYNITDVFTELLPSSMQFNIQLWNAFVESYPLYLTTISEYDKSWKDLSGLDAALRSKFRKALNDKFRQDKFVNSLSDNVASYSKLANSALRNSSARVGDVVAIIGIGGLRHLGIQFASKMGFKTFAIGRGKGKEELARKLGAIHYIDSQSQNAAEDLAKMGGAKVKNPLPA